MISFISRSSCSRKANLSVSIYRKAKITWVELCKRCLEGQALCMNDWQVRLVTRVSLHVFCNLGFIADQS